MSTDTKEALLDAGEKLLAEEGITALSIRAITEAAGANLGAITYHFGSKDRFLEEIFLRRIRPVYRDRITRLDALEASLDGKQPKLEDIIDILIRPVVEARGVEGNELSVQRLLQRGMQDIPPEITSALEKESAEFIQRSDEAILKAVPNLPPKELFWRRKFLLGALSFGVDAWVSTIQMSYPNTGGQSFQIDSEGLIQRLVTFICAGITAPAMESTEE